MVFLFAVFFFGISDSFSIKVTYCFDLYGFDDSGKMSFLFAKHVAGAFDLPFSSSIFQIQSFISPLVFGLLLCCFLSLNQWTLLYPTDISLWFKLPTSSRLRGPWHKPVFFSSFEKISVLPMFFFPYIWCVFFITKGMFWTRM